MNSVLKRLKVLAGVDLESPVIDEKVETARGISDATWEKMKRTERKKYVETHPKSRFALDPKYGFAKKSAKKNDKDFFNRGLKNEEVSDYFDNFYPESVLLNCEKQLSYLPDKDRKFLINKSIKSLDFGFNDMDDVKAAKAILKKYPQSKKRIDTIVKERVDYIKGIGSRFKKEGDTLYISAPPGKTRDGLRTSGRKWDDWAKKEVKNLNKYFGTKIKLLAPAGGSGRR